MSPPPPVAQIHDREDVDEVVPVSSWAKEGITPLLPHAVSQAQLVEFGPLTAQGNFYSQMDEPLRWRSLTSAESMSHTQAPFYDDSMNYPSVSYDIFGSSESPGGGWTDMNGGYVNSAYPMFGQHSAVSGNVYDTISPTHGYYDTIQSPTFVSSGPSPSLAREALGPWNGIWKFNPDNVAENFVYPTAENPTVMQPPPSFPPSHTNSSQPPSATVPVPADSVSPTNDQAVASGAWVVASRQSPSSRSEPKLSPPRQASDPTEAQQAQARRKSDASHLPRTLKPERVKRNRTVQTQLLVPRRQGPLSVEQRQKADDMRYYGACWRCRRYKKPCNGPGECDTCKTSGFRVWPSTIGCYRGNMEDFISGVMPGNAEVIMRDLHEFGKQPNWKVHFGYQPDMRPLPRLTGSEDRFAKLSVKLQATRMAGPGFVELLEILADFQRSRTKPDMCLEHACEALSYICDVYHAFVKTDTTISLLPSELLTALTKFRSHYSANWRHFLALCLSGRRSAWFPAFLCACINVPLLVVLKDGFVAIPEPTRSSLWPNISFLIEDLRNRLYPMGLDLLSALAKGIKPWQLKCWGMVPSVDPATKKPIPGRFERDPDGLRLLGGDVGAFDGFSAIQTWLERHREAMYYGVSFLTTPPFSERNAKMQPVAALAWIFEVAPPGQKLVGGRLVEDLSEENNDAGLGGHRPRATTAVSSAA